MSTPELARRESKQLRALIHIQAISGLLLAGFLTLHLGNALCALLGPGAYDGVIRCLRRLYQTPAAELLLLATIVVHALAGWWRYARFHRDKPAKAPVTKAHRLIGRVLSLVVILHILGTRLPAWVGGLEVDMAFLTFSLENYGAFFYPYYIALFVAGAYHLIRGTQVAAAALRLPSPRTLLRLSPTGARRLGLGLVATAILVVLALGGWFYPVDRSGYDGYRAYQLVSAWVQPGCAPSRSAATVPWWPSATASRFGIATASSRPASIMTAAPSPRGVLLCSTPVAF